MCGVVSAPASQGHYAVYGDLARLVMTFAHAGFQPFLEDPAVNADWPR